MRSLSDQRRFWRRSTAGLVVAAVLLTATSYAAAGDAPFSDVPLDHEFADEIHTVAAAGIADGFPDGSYRPSQAVTRQAMAAFLARSGTRVTRVTGLIDATLNSTSNEVIRNAASLVPGADDTLQRVVATAEISVNDVDTTGCSPCTVAVSITGTNGQGSSGDRFYTLVPNVLGDVQDTLTVSHVFTVDGGTHIFNLNARVLTDSAAGTPNLTVVGGNLTLLTVPFDGEPDL